MPLFYDFYPSPVPEGDDREAMLHARVVTAGTVDMRDLAKLIQEGSTATTGDVMLVVEQLVKHLRRQLSYGKRVHINGLGYLQLTLENRPVSDPYEIRAESVHVKSVVLRPDKDMIQAVRDFKVTRNAVKRHSRELTDEEVETRLRAYFSDNSFMTARDFRNLCSMAKTTAFRRLNILIEKGKLSLSDKRLPTRLYIPGDNL